MEAVSEMETLSSTQLAEQEVVQKSYSQLVELYKNGKPVEVDFRELVSWVPYADSETHYIHSYPAKLLKHIPIYFLNSPISPKKGIVLDPFCGTGTVLLEAIKVGLDAYGVDANPLARLIAGVKTQKLESTGILQNLEVINSNRHKQYEKLEYPNVTNLDLWFLPRIKEQLNSLRYLIETHVDENFKEFFNVCFSNILKKVSLADPNLSVPVRLKPEKYKKEELRNKAINRLNSIQVIDVFEVFDKQVNDNLKRLDRLNAISGLGTAKVIGKDAKKLRFDANDNNGKCLADESVDLIITSPPYAGAQKYVRASSFSLGWLGFCDKEALRSIEGESIGREHYSTSEYKEPTKFDIPDIDNRLAEIYEKNALRAHINGNYLREMKFCIEEMYRVLKPNCYCVLVMGNNEVCGKPFNTQKFINLLAEEAGFRTDLKLVDAIHSRGLMTKRNKTASIINSEWIMILRK